MNDRELLELAAKAVGGVLCEGTGKKRTGPTWDTWEWCGPVGISLPDGTVSFPLLSDRDALRLAVKLSQMDGGVALMLNSLLNSTAFAQCYTNRNVVSPAEYMGDDPYAATRRAIVRAAAEIGKTL